MLYGHWTDGSDEVDIVMRGDEILAFGAIALTSCTPANQIAGNVYVSLLPSGLRISF
jgi:hypothetical protein